MKLGIRGLVWPTLILALGLSACGKAEEPAATPDALEMSANTLPQEGEPAVEQPDRASAPLVPQAEINTDPVTILGETTPIRFVGQEPDWEAILDEGWIVFERPGLPLIEAPIPELPDAAAGQLSFEAGTLSLEFVSAGCESVIGTLAVTILYEDVSYQGCGGAQEADDDEMPEAIEVSWQGLIYEYLPAIDACLDAADGPRLIRALYPREGNTAGMILMDEVGRYEECGADAETADISFFDPVTADQAEIWFEGDAVFERGEDGPPCRAVEPMLDLIIGDDFGIMHPAGCR